MKTRIHTLALLLFLVSVAGCTGLFLGSLSSPAAREFPLADRTEVVGNRYEADRVWAGS